MKNQDFTPTCQVCNDHPAKWAMYPNDSTAPRCGGNGTPVPMCTDCAMDAFEHGTHEADGELDESPEPIKPPDPFLKFAENYLKNVPNGAK